VTRQKNLLNAETLVWVARTGTFRAAAEKLFTSQPAVSARMRELETSLGVPLFEKSGRNLKLTPAARRFVERVEPLLTAVESAFMIDSPEQDTLQASGTLRVGMGEITMSWFAHLFKDFRNKMPRISYEIELDLAYQLKRKLRQGALDVAIVAGPVEHGRFLTQPVGMTKMQWVISSSVLKDPAYASWSLSDFFNTLLLWTISKPSEYAAAAQHVLRQNGVTLEHFNTCNHLVSLIAIVENGGGIAQLPEIMISERLRDGSFTALSDCVEDSELNFFVVSHKDRDNPALDWLITNVLESGRSVLRPQTA